MEKKKIANCYQCRWRGHLPGDAHSKCCHPYNRGVADNPLLKLLGAFAGVGRADFPAIAADKRLEIRANPAGLRGGWFHYPFNFDPIWLENCKGFAALTEDDPRRANKHYAEDTYGEAETCEQCCYCEECPKRFQCFTERGEETQIVIEEDEE